jgi:hypothetical protein
MDNQQQQQMGRKKATNQTWLYADGFMHGARLICEPLRAASLFLHRHTAGHVNCSYNFPLNAGSIGQLRVSASIPIAVNCMPNG